MSDEEKWLGKIIKAEFGFGGYDDAMIGLTLQFQGQVYTTQDFKGVWSTDRSQHAKWTEEDRVQQVFEAVWLLKDTLAKAKRKHVGQLVGVPVEVTSGGNMIKSWRVLEEVL